MNTRKSTRYHVRIRLKIPVEVYYAEFEGSEWIENTLTENVSVCGAAFTLSHPAEPNRLVRLRMPLPKQFRLFDYSKEHYEVWALIRYLRLAESDDPEQIRLLVGAAFIGDKPPQSFSNNHNTSYDLMPVLQTGNFWHLREMPRRSGAYARSSEERRPIRIKIGVESVNDQGRKVAAMAGETLNISESGMAVVADLSDDRPKYVLITSEDPQASLLAAVRSVFKLDEGNSFRLHLEFVSGKWAFD